VNAGGSQVVASGALASFTTVNSGGFETVSGGTTTGTTVNSGGQQQVFQDGVTSGTTLNSGGFEVLSGDGFAFASGTTIDQGATLELQDHSVAQWNDGAVAAGTILFDGVSASMVVGGQMPTAVISGLAIGDTIDLSDLLYAASNTFSVAGDSLVVSGGSTDTLTIDGASGDFFLLTSATDGGTAILLTAAPPSGLTLSPGSDSGLIPGDDITDDTTPDITGLGVAGETIVLYAGTVEVGSGTVDGSGAWSITTSPLSAGVQVLSAVQEVGGATSDPSGTLDVTIDLTTPPAPAALALAPSSDSGAPGGDITNVTTPVITGTGDAGDTITLYDGTVDIGSGTVDGSGSWAITTSLLAAGVHVLTATETELGGNVSAPSGTLDLTIDLTTPPAPAALALAPSSDSGAPGGDITNVTTPVITGTGDAGDTITLYDGTADIGSGTVDGSGAWAITTSTLAAGMHVLTATQTELGGNVSEPSGTLDLTIDTTTPSTPTLAFSADSGSTTAESLQPTLTGTADAGDVVTVLVGDSAVGTATADGQGVWSYGFTADLAGGADVITVTAADLAGNVSAAAAALTTVIDGTLSWAAPVDGAFTQSGDWLFDDAATAAVPNATDTVYFDTGSDTPYTVSGDGSAAQMELGADLVSFTGTITTTGGTTSLQVDPGGTLAVGASGTQQSTLTLAGGDLQAPDSAGAATVSSTVTLTSGTTSTLESAGAATLTMSGAITGSGALLIGGGTVSLTNTGDDYTGGTTVSGAVLEVADAAALGSGPLATAADTSNTLDLGSGSFDIDSAGDDTIHAGSGAAVVQGGAGTLTFIGGSGSATVTGGAGGGVITGGSGGHNQLFAGSGNTTLTGGGAGDTLVGGSGDTMLVCATDDVAFGGTGNATLYGAAAGSDTLVGGSGTDVLVARGSHQQLWGGSATNTLFGNGTDDTLVGGAGNTTLVSGAGGEAFAGTGSTALFGAAGGDDILVGGAGNDALAAEGADQQLWAGSGNDTLSGGGAGDSLSGGSGNDVIVAGAGDDVFGGSGASTVYAVTGPNTVLTGPGRMLLAEGGATDTVLFGSGQATASGTGHDTYEFVNGSSGGTDVIDDYEPGRDQLALFGYASDSATWHSAGATTMLTLSDGTHITLMGVSSLAPSALHFS